MYNGLGVSASLYGISNAEFEAYIQSLLDSGHITRFIEDGLTYYNITAIGANLLRKWNKKDILGAIQAGAAVAAVVVPIVAAI